MSDRFDRLLALIDGAIKADPGYDQSQRWAYLDKAGRRLLPGMEADCSAMTIGLVWLAGYPVPDENIANNAMPCWTGNAPALLASAGWASHNTVGWSVDQIQRATTAGDVLLGDGHIMIKHRSGLWWSMNQDENGNALGGRRGDQTGSESSLRPLWARHGGWLAYFTAPDKGASAHTQAAQMPTTPAQSFAKYVTPDVVKLLQKALGLTVDGIAGPLTVAALIKKAGGDPTMPRLDTPSNTVKKIQKYLNGFVGAPWCTYGRLTTDGLLGPATAEAIRVYLLKGHGAFTGLERTTI